MSYVLIIKCRDDHPAALRIMGTFPSRERALAAETRARKLIDAAVEADPALADDYGYAYALPVERLNIDAAVEYALRGDGAGLRPE